MSNLMEYLNEVREMQAVSIAEDQSDNNAKPSFEEYVAAKNSIANENKEATVTLVTSKNRDLNEDYE